VIKSSTTRRELGRGIDGEPKSWINVNKKPPIAIVKSELGLVPSKVWRDKDESNDQFNGSIFGSDIGCPVDRLACQDGLQLARFFPLPSALVNFFFFKSDPECCRCHWRNEPEKKNYFPPRCSATHPRWT